MKTKPTRTLRTQKDLAWTQWSVADIKKASQKYLDALEKDIARLLAIPDEKRTFENTYWALETAGAPHGNVQQFLSMLSHCSTRESVRQAARNAMDELGERSLAILHRPELYQAVRACKLDTTKLDPDVKKYVHDTLEGFRRSGFELAPKEFRRFQKNSIAKQKLSTKFDAHLANYSAVLRLPVSKSTALDLPDSYLATLPKKKGMYEIGSTPAQFGPFMSYCNDPEWRKKMLRIVGKKGGRANLTILQKLLKLRQENARLLGFKSHAAYVLDKRMAKSIDAVYSLHQEVSRTVSGLAQKDLHDIEQMKKEKGGKGKLESHDVAFYTRLLQEKRYNLDPEEIRQYFQLENVLSTMFGVAQKLFGITITPKKWKTWHPDTRSYEVKMGSEIMGYVIMDLHPRTGKYTHAMAHDICDAGLKEWGRGKYETPITAIVANFRSPGKKLPSLLSFGEVTTLFHEFGHALHNTLTTARIPSQAGFHTVWDFVELPSQILEEWAWLPSVIKKMSSHVESHSKMPDTMIRNILDSRYFFEGAALARQVSMGEFDMHIHEKIPPQSLDKVYQKIAKKYSPFPTNKDSLFPASFGHIAHGYDAGYYSYLWSRVYAFDCFNYFQKNGVMSRSVGKKYWQEILSRGSSRPEAESLKKFLGRKPSVKAFLKNIKKG